MKEKPGVTLTAITQNELRLLKRNETYTIKTQKLKGSGQAFLNMFRAFQQHFKKRKSDLVSGERKKTGARETRCYNASL